jgi:hypothetical protein
MIELGDDLSELSHMDRAALITTQHHLMELEALSRNILELVADIHGLTPSAAIRLEHASQTPNDTVLMERVYGTARVVIGLWLSFLIWLYIDPPGHQAIVTMTVSVSLALTGTPWLPTATLWRPFAVSITFAGLVYVVVMPALDGIVQFSIMMFVVTFLICYVNWGPKRALGRSIGLAFFVVLISVNNHQSYSFAGFANQAMMLLIVAGIINALAYLPVSSQPEKAMLRILQQYFKTIDYQLARLAIRLESERGYFDRVRSTFRSGDPVLLARTLLPWSRLVDAQLYPESRPKQLDAFITALQAMALRTDELIAARNSPHAPAIIQDLAPDFDEWRLAIQTELGMWADSLDTAASDELARRLQATLDHMERRIDATFEAMAEDDADPEEERNLYRLLGAFRGFSQSALQVAGTLQACEPRAWRESRF